MFGRQPLTSCMIVIGECLSLIVRLLSAHIESATLEEDMANRRKCPKWVPLPRRSSFISYLSLTSRVYMVCAVILSANASDMVW
jgi:hypothetical protein